MLFILGSLIHQLGFNSVVTFFLTGVGFFISAVVIFMLIGTISNGIKFKDSLYSKIETLEENIIVIQEELVSAKEEVISVKKMLQDIHEGATQKTAHVRILHSHENYESALIAFNELAQFTSQAEKSIHLFYGDSLRRYVDRLSYSEKISHSEAREKFFKGIIAKAKIREDFSYQTIIQVPQNQSLQTIIKSDLVLVDHAWDLVKLHNNNNNCYLKTCWPCFDGSFIIIDDEYLVLPISIADTRNGKYFLTGFDIRQDPKGDLIQTYKKMFGRFEQRSKIITRDMFFG